MCLFDSNWDRQSVRKLLNINNCGYAFFESVEFVPYIMNVLILSRRFSLNDNDYTFI